MEQIFNLILLAILSWAVSRIAYQACYRIVNWWNREVEIKNE